MITFARSSTPIFPACSGFPIIISIASSDVARNTAINVPTVMIPPEYRFAAITENPH